MKSIFSISNLLLIFILSLNCLNAWGQITIVNYNFNSGTTFPTLVPTLTAGVTCTASSSETFNTLSGTASGSIAFTPNATAGSAISMPNSNGNNSRYFQFQIGGSSLTNYLSYKIYCQSQSSATGASIITLAYSTDGITYTNFINTGSSGNGNFAELLFDLSSIISLNNQSMIYFRLFVSGASGTGTCRIDNFQVQGQTAPKYYRSSTSGDWNNLSTWESSTDNISWAPALTSPASSDHSIFIQPIHTVIVSTPVSLDETTVAGNLQVLTGGGIIINDGPGDDINIQNNGSLQVLSTDAFTTAIIPGTSVINISSGGKITIGNGTVAVGAGYETLATSLSNIWNNASVFEWNTPTDFTFSGNVYFPNAGAGVIPIFSVRRVTGPIGGPGDATINGLLSANTNFSFGGNGSKNFRNGISGNNNNLTFNNITGTYNITNSNSEISGNLTFILNKDIRINQGTTIKPGSIIIVSNVSLNGFSRQAGDFIIAANARLDMGYSTITNSSPGNVIINGTFATANSGGFTGGGSTIPSGSVILNAGCTVEYNSMNNQIVTARSDYQNIIFSGSGIKTLASAFAPLISVYITGNAIVNANHNLGDNGTIPLTNFTMDGGRLILTSTGTQPCMTGNYTLTAGVVEFASSQSTSQTIRSKNYQNIEVTGNNVGNSNGNINLNANGSFTVKSGGIFEINDNSITGTGGTQIVTVENGAIFRTGNNEGFNGFNAALTNNSSVHQNISSINLNAGSTVEYIRATDQPITNSNGIIYSNLLISGSGIKTAPAGILTVQGNLMKGGTSSFAQNGGIVLLNGLLSQSFAGLTYNNLILSNNIKTTSGNSTIIDSIKISTGTTLSVSASDKITLHSDSIKTARMAIVDGNINYNSTGKFVVERFISARKAWRFLAIPANTTQTIKQAWQEGAMNTNSNPAPGFGAQITSNIASWLADGFDVYSAGGSSMKTYNPVTDNYSGITSTLNPFIPGSGGYMTFIRGDRSANNFLSPVSFTVLRTTGSLFTGDQPNINVISGQITPVNNPYASSIDLRKLSKSYNVFYYVWDPNRGGGYGLGAFQTLLWNGINYNVVPGNSGSYMDINNFIESGQAFFVSTFGPDTLLQLRENIKSSATFTISPFTSVTFSGQLLRTNLHSIIPGGSPILTDGVLHIFDETYSNDVDGMDAKKLANFGENLAIKSNDKLLSIERRYTLQVQDTLLYDLTGMKAQQYQLEFIADKLEMSGLVAFLEDNYLKTRTHINLSGTTKIDFLINADAGSSASNRFRMVFEAAAGALPVTFTNVKAYLQNRDIAIEWHVENETGMKQYEVEKSLDGTDFSYRASLTANNMRQNNYKWVDVQPSTGYNFYRIKSRDINGETKFSEVVKIFFQKGIKEITIYPNPIKHGIINLQLVDQPEGKYKIRLINKSGQVIISKKIIHTMSTSTEPIKCEYNLTHGIYCLEITKPDGSLKNINLMY